jgi:hypothetical protein
MRVTATTCLDGKRHRWKSLMYQPGRQDNPVSSEVKMCRVCGTCAEFYCDLNKRGSPRRTWKRCREPDGSYQVEIPECHKTPAELRAERLAKRRADRRLIGECEETAD